MSYSVKSGPLAGIEFASERQYRNARRYVHQHGQIPEPLALSRAYQSQHEKENRLQRSSGMDAATYQQMRQYFAVRAAQFEAAMLDAEGLQHLTTREMESLNLAPRSEFLRYWDDAVKHNFTGPAMDRLMAYAGMRDTGGILKNTRQWETYKRLIEWYAQNEPRGFTREPWRALPRNKKGRWIYPRGFGKRK